MTKRHISERVIGDQYEENREEHNRSGIKWRNGNWNAFGCGSKSIDGEKTVATVDGTDIPMGVVSLYARESQAQTVAMYKSFMGSAGNIWSQVVDEDLWYYIR